MFALLALPDPLHPAVVHFPIVLLVLGTAIAVIAAFVPRGTLPLIAAALLALGAIGAVVGVQTGEREGEMIKETPAIEAVLEEHEEWAERTQTVALIAAALAIGAVITTKRWPKVGPHPRRRHRRRRARRLLLRRRDRSLRRAIGLSPRRRCKSRPGRHRRRQGTAQIAPRKRAPLGSASAQILPP